MVIKEDIGPPRRSCVFPTEERGLGLRAIFDISRAMKSNFNEISGLRLILYGGIYMGNKYCKKFHLIFAPNIGVSHIWMSMVQIKKEIESFI